MISKAQCARKMFAQLMRRKNAPERKVFIQAFVDERGLSPRGDNTYLYNIQQEYVK